MVIQIGIWAPRSLLSVRSLSMIHRANKLSSLQRLSKERDYITSLDYCSLLMCDDHHHRRRRHHVEDDDAVTLLHSAL